MALYVRARMSRWQPSPFLFIGNPKGNIPFSKGICLWNIPFSKGICLSQKYPKSAFTIHDDIFQRLIELKIFIWLRTILVPTKQFWTHSETVSEHCFSSAKSYYSGSGYSGTFPVFSRKIPRSFQNDSGTLQELSGVCRNQFELMVSPETTF